MKVEFMINDSADPKARYVTWAPSPCRVRVTDPAGSTGPTVTVQLTARSTASAGAVVFRTGASGAFTASLTLQLPVAGQSVPFFVAGKFGRPSMNDGDVAIEARAGTALAGSVAVMVRIRKNANTLAPAERDRFLAAFAQLNNKGTGRFVDFREMHRTDESLAQAHGAAGFLPWHRAYLLDLERELQAIDPSVALHYWRFDQPAPKVFTREFLGESDTLGTVRFDPGNPLQFWVTDGVPGINRLPLFPTSSAPPNPRSEAATLALGNLFRQFRTMEVNPHGFAHTSFEGMVHEADTAPRDPLFFLLHANVDRLWAKWQRQVGRFNPALKSSFDDSAASDPGHRLNDTMWPWNGVTGGTRPPFAPGGPLATSPATAAPGLQPRVSDCIDFQGSVDPRARMAFDYDDVPFA